MKILSQEMKKQMEECKERARKAGLQFSENTLEFIITNQDMLELMPKNMIPTLYDYWVQDIEVYRNKWIYDIYPHNLYEVTINSRPPISYYLQDNADWWNRMLFYHVLGHIDIDLNNVYFRKTWDDNFVGQALADKRLIEKIRQERGSEKRWVDYVIEFALAIDNLVGYYQELEEADQKGKPEIFGKVSEKIDFYFGEFLKKRYEEKVIELKFYYDEIARYNRCGETAFFEDNFFLSKFPEFHAVFKKWKEKNKSQKPKPKDVLQYLMEHSEFINKEENKWMKDVIQVIRRTSLYFQPMLRTKIVHEGWASLWHERLYTTDESIKGHAIDYSFMDAHLVVDPRIGLNPYAVGKHLFEFIEELASKGKLSREYRLIKDIEARRHFDRGLGKDYGREVLFEVAHHVDDYQLINFLSDEDFQDFMEKYDMFMVGIRPPKDIERLLRGMLEVYIKSKKAKDFRRLLNEFLYHPPYYELREENGLYINHIYEGRTLVTEYIPNVLIGIEFLNGAPVHLETTEYEKEEDHYWYFGGRPEPEHKKVRVLYTCQNRKVERKVID